MIRRRSRTNDTRTELPTGVPALEDLRPLMALELDRARRYERPLAIVALSAEGLVPNGRMIDLVAFSHRTGDYILMLPETDASGAGRMADRVLGDSADPRVAIATFPEDAVTLDGLLARVLGE